MARRKLHRSLTAIVLGLIQTMPTSADELQLGLKDGVEIDELSPELRETFEAVISTWEICVPGIRPVITGGHEATYDRSSRFSYHWYESANGFHAYDLRMRGLTLGQGKCIARELSQRVPHPSKGRIDVVVHWELFGTASYHAHIEHDIGAQHTNETWPPKRFR